MISNRDKINIVSLNIRFMFKINKFKRIYDLFQRRKMNILLIQKFEIIRKL